MGACSDTTEWNGEYILNNNYQYSKNLLEFALKERVSFIFASSASVYGLNKNSQISTNYENPINAYAYSKLLFDQYVRKFLDKAESQIVGLRYFNVFGPNEAHKGKMASVMYRFYNQIMEHGTFSIFGGYNEIGSGEHSRDFIHVNDTVQAKLWFLNNPKINGIYNIGTGISNTYNKLGECIINWFEANSKIKPQKNYIDFPKNLQRSYQTILKQI